MIQPLPLAALLAVAPLLLAPPSLAQDAPATRPSAVEPDAVRSAVEAGIDYLIAHQHENGGWAQGEVAPQMRSMVEHDPSLLTDPIVADTSIAVLALIRAGHADAE